MRVRLILAFFLLESSAGACGAENFPVAETKSGGAQFCGAAIGPFGPDARRVGSFGMMWMVEYVIQLVSLSELAVFVSRWVEWGIGRDNTMFWTRHLVVQLALDAVRCADFGERAVRDSLDSFGNDAFLSCRIESPS